MRAFFRWLATIGWLTLCGPAGCSQAPLVRRPVDPLVEARRLTKSGQADEAYEKFEELVRDQPRNLTAHRGLVEAGYYAGHLKSLEQRYRALTRRGDMAGIGHYGLGLLYVARGPGHMQQAIEAFDQAARRMPEEADVPYRIGLIHLMNGAHRQAAQVLERAIEMDPDDAGIRVAYGGALLHLGRKQEAIDVMRRILVLAPSPETAGKARVISGKVFDPMRDVPLEVAQDLRRAMDYFVQDAVQQALALAEKVLARSPETAFAHTLKGLAHSRLENNGEAIVAFEKALQLRPASPAALVGLGDVYARLEQWSQAREYYEKALTLDPFDIGAHERMGDMAVMRQDADRAAAAYANLVLLAPERVDFRHKWARALVAAGQPEQAVTVYEDILEMKPDDMESLVRLGILHVALGRRDPVDRERHRERARGYLEQAHELNPENQAVHDMLSKLED